MDKVYDYSWTDGLHFSKSYLYIKYYGSSSNNFHFYLEERDQQNFGYSPHSPLWGATAVPPASGHIYIPPPKLLVSFVMAPQSGPHKLFDITEQIVPYLQLEDFLD